MVSGHDHVTFDDIIRHFVSLRFRLEGMPTPKSRGAMKQRKRRISAKRRAIYRRRRIVVGVACLLVVAVGAFCAYSLVRGFGAIGAAARHDDIYAVSRSAVPDPTRTSGIKNCSANDVDLSLTAESQNVAVGGSLNFTATIKYTGSGKKGCLIDASDANLVLTITSGDETIWRSDVCPADPRLLLMAKGDADKRQIVWNADATGDACAEDDSLPKVNAGTYVAKLSLKDQPKVASDPVTISVQ